MVRLGAGYIELKHIAQRTISSCSTNGSIDIQQVRRDGA